MSTKETANKYVSMNREGKMSEIINELYADTIISKEMPNWPGPTVIEGKQGVIDKNEQWMANVEEFHAGTISDPLVAGNHFSVTMSFDVTFKDSGRRQMEEVAVFEVENGQIVSEQFFYSM